MGSWGWVSKPPHQLWRLGERGKLPSVVRAELSGQSPETFILVYFLPKNHVRTAK